MLTLQQLQVFCAVAEHLHFTRAAEALNLTQPAVTFHIRSMERHLRLQLVEVRGRRLYLTAAGEFLRQRAVEVLNSVSTLERQLQQFSNVQVGWLKLGATLTIGNYVLPPILKLMRTRYPGIHLSLEIANTALMELALLSRELDMAVVEWRIGSPEIEVVPFQKDELVIAVPVGHELSGQEEVAAEQLLGEPFILREQGSGTRALALESIGPLADRLNVVLELGTTEAIKGAVRAGIGITIISQTIIKGEIERGELCALRIAGKKMERDFSLAFVRTHVHSPAMEAFFTTVLDSLSIAQKT